MNIAESFALFFDEQGYGTLGTDLFISSIPLDYTGNGWWIVWNGGSTIVKNVSGERTKNYVLSVYYRHTDAEVVYDWLQQCEELINLDPCTQLSGFDTISIDVTQFGTDQDLDDLDRTVGLLQVTITTYL